MRKSITEQLLRDPNVQPTDEVFSAALGESYAAFLDFIEMIKDIDVKLSWRYYIDGKAWLAKGLHQWHSARGTAKEKTVFWLSVWEGFFKISIFFAERYRAEIQNLPLSDTTRKNIQDAKVMGKMKFFPLVFEVDSKAMFDDIRALAQYQKSKK